MMSSIYKLVVSTQSYNLLITVCHLTSFISTDSSALCPYPTSMDTLENIGELQFGAAVDDANSAVQEEGAAGSAESGQVGAGGAPREGLGSGDASGGAGGVAVDSDAEGAANNATRRGRSYSFFAGAAGEEMSAGREEDQQACCSRVPVCGCCRSCMSSLSKIQLRAILPKVRGPRCDLAG